MELFGRGYVFEHCISTLKLHKEKEQERKTFELYVTDALMCIASNTTHVATIGGIEDYGSSLSTRWIDILEPPKIEPQDNRPCEEIASDIFARIRGK